MSESLEALRVAVDGPRVQVVSTDVFNTLVMRDATAQGHRLARGARRAAAQLGVPAETLVDLRWTAHVNAYRAVRVEGEVGEATLDAMSRCTARAAGLGPGGAARLRAAEVEVDAAHLRPHAALVAVLDGVRARGVRVVAVSDTWYSAADVRTLLVAVLGRLPVDEIYTSADLGHTKHAGGIFALVGAREQVAASAFVHVGDDVRADVAQARAAGWTAVHVPRVADHRGRRWAGRLRSAPVVLRQRG